jgi:hypothetical protein
MKPLLSVLLLVAFTSVPVLAGELLNNSDFSQGHQRWLGNVFDSDSQQSDPFNNTPAAPGLTINLRANTWSRIYQEFTGKGAPLKVEVVYKLAPGSSFSDKADDYNNVTHSIGYEAWKSFKIPVGNWCLLISDFGPDKGRYFYIKPDFSSTAEQTVGGVVTSKDKEKKTITLAIPPGTGSITLLKVSVSDSK